MFGLGSPIEATLRGVGSTPIKERDHDTLHAAIRLVFNDLGVALAMETSSLVVQVTEIPDQARALAREALYTGVHRAFTIARSHYINIDLPVIREGFALGYTDVRSQESGSPGAGPGREGL